MLRRRSFWLGLLGLLFLLWLWGISFRHGYNFTWRGNQGQGIFLRTDRPGTLEAGWRGDAGWRVPMGRAFTTWRMGQDDPDAFSDAPCFPLPQNTSVKPLRAHSVVLPHWLLVVAYVAGWSLALWAFRARRGVQART